MKFNEYEKLIGDEYINILNTKYKNKREIYIFVLLLLLFCLKYGQIYSQVDIYDDFDYEEKYFISRSSMWMNEFFI
jgi:hypothetical protein